ncbi:protein DEHYDRATION-INDUCED 19 homolog 4 [Andrographis paniculata]|uniref:protein DEHYDRATION-INDUCED 19 homolog 4 n=1 Tax=Andrographis paniculata TaxID=175694 RepID=UPI0021E7DF75|nr:protein DEHYDRATION-INDUCED 19 homolog 4 [Andrographis paniculata]
MDAESWPRLSSYSRRYQSRSGNVADVYHGEDYEADEEQRPEYICPFCAEDYDMVGLCCHIDEEHAVEAKNGVCPVCAKRVGSGLIRHLTVQHGSLLKVQRRRRLRRGGSNFSFANLRRELRDGNVHSLLGGGSSLFVSSSRAEPDPLLSSFISNPPVADEPSVIKPLSSVEAGSAAKGSVEDLADGSVACQTPLLSDEDLKEKTQKCEFVQGLLLSTFLDDNL